MYCERWRRPGMTLIEVLAGMVLLSTLLALVVVATGRLSAGIREADNRLKAVRLLEDQLVRWYGKLGRLPSDGTGDLAVDGEAYRWRITRLPGRLGRIPARRVRVEVFLRGSPDVLVSVELLESLPETRLVSSR